MDENSSNDRSPGDAGSAGITPIDPVDHDSIKEYFHLLRQRIFIGLLIAFLAPLAILSLYFHFQFNNILRKSSKLHLTSLAESQRNTIDLFIQERLVNIFNLFRISNFTLTPSPDDMRLYLQHLRIMSDAFVDVGFLDSSGIQIGYTGPYPYLQGRNYSNEAWFQTLMGSDKNYLITDIYLGFRQKPHFTIAVKQIFAEKPYIMRATIDPDKFYLFLRNISRGEGVDSSLINRDGRYQIVNPDQGELLGNCDYMPPERTGSGANEIKTKTGNLLVAYSWLNEAPWVLVVKQPLKIAYAEMYRLRRIMIAVTLILVFILVVVIRLTTDRLLKRAEATEESRKELQWQLIHAAKLVSAGELAAGVAHEINNPLAIISTESGLIRDMLDPQFGMKYTPKMITDELEQIDKAVFRARDITHKLLDIVRRTEPKLALSNLNQLLAEVVDGLMEKEFEVSNIRLIRDYDPQLPDALLDADQIRQVLLNIINNAGDAIGRGGKITLTTRHDDKFVWVTIRDTGKGMTSEQMEKIFLPFFTTKEPGKGTGLGLSISLSIVEAMGGRIEVQSMPGVGSAFTVVLPINPPQEKQGG